MQFRVEQVRALATIGLVALFASQSTVEAHSHAESWGNATQPAWSSTDPAPADGREPGEAGRDCELCGARALLEGQVLDAAHERVDGVATSPEALFSGSRVLPRRSHFLAALPTRGPPLS